MFFSSKLNKFENLRHCFFSRKNGVSKGYYESLNCGSGSNDDKENVLKNLQLVSKKIACNSNFLITLNQKHSNKVIYFENEKSVKNKLTGDAIVSKVKNIGISILAADCAPLLFYAPKTKIIVTGCYAQLKPKEIQNLQGVELVIGATDKFNVEKYIIENEITDAKVDKIEDVNKFDVSYSLNERTRAFLKIQDGCDYNCTYCTIPRARGKSRSDNIDNTIYFS